MLDNPEKIAIWGYGREGKAAMRHLKTRYPNAAFWVIDKILTDAPEGFQFMDEHTSSEKIAAGFFNLVVKSPGVSLYRPDITAAKESGTIFTSGTNLWFDLNPHARTIAVTGTKGKSTTSSLIHHLMQKKNVLSVLAGNIGTALLDTPPGQDVTVIEMSSYQIADLTHAPDMAVVTNVYPAHGDWHGSDAQYFADKMRLIDLCGGRPVIVSAADERLCAKTKRRDKTIYFSASDHLPALPDHLNAPHLRLNVAAAIKACETFGVSGPWDGLLHDFKPLPHRQERIGEREGVLYVNDSIATVPESTLAALEVFKDRPITLLIGGQEKGQDYAALAEKISAHEHILVITLPDNGGRIAGCLNNAIIADDLSHAVKLAQEKTPKGGVILLSPSAPSYGRFKNFEERGNLFRTLSGF